MKQKLRFSPTIYAFITCVFLFSAKGNAQSADSLRLEQLTRQVETLQNLIVYKDSTIYADTRDKLINGFHNSYVLYDKISMRDREISEQQTSIRLLNLNNPGTSQMINRFGDYMKQLVTSKLSHVINGDSTRKRKIFRTLENIFQNPVIAPIVHSNPISTAISSAYNFISSLVEPRVDIEKGGITNAVKNVKVELVNILESKVLNGLTSDLLPYVRFFDTLYMINNQFTTKLSLIRQRSKALSENFATVWNYYAKLGITPDQTPVMKQKLFEEKFPEVKQNNQPGRYAEYLQANSIRDAVRYSDEVQKAYIRFNELTEDYTTALREFRNQYIAVLAKYKDQLSLYAAELQQSYNELTSPSVAALEIGHNISNRPDSLSAAVNPLEVKVNKAVWIYNWVDAETKSVTDKIFDKR